MVEKMSARQGDQRNIRVLQFLDAYEKQESLWNPALESYKNKSARDEAYMCIIRALNVPSLTINDVKLKVKSIRTTYTKELRLLTKHKEQGKPYNPKLFWFNRANAFLRDVSLSRDKRVNYTNKYKMSTSDDFKPCVMDYITEEPTDVLSNVEEDHCNSNSSAYEYKALPATDIEAHMQNEINVNTAVQATANVDDGCITTKSNNNNALMSQQHEYQTLAATSNSTSSNNVASTATLKFTAPVSGVEHTLCDTSSVYISATTSNQNNPTHTSATHSSSSGVTCTDDEYDVFCRSVAVQLRSISDTYSRSVAKLKIQQILFEAETGHYRNTSCISIPALPISQPMNNL